MSKERKGALPFPAKLGPKAQGRELLFLRCRPALLPTPQCLGGETSAARVHSTALLLGQEAGGSGQRQPGHPAGRRLALIHGLVSREEERREKLCCFWL